jgi:subtilisin family serine protease
MRYRLKLLIALIPALVIGLPAQAAQVHPDLVSWMEGADLDATRDVVVQLEEGFKGSDVGDLFGSARLHREFKKLGMAHVEVTPPTLQTLANDPRLFALNPDTTVRMLGKGKSNNTGPSDSGSSSPDEGSTSPEQGSPSSEPAAPLYSLLQQVTGAGQAMEAFGVTGNGISVAVLDSGTAGHLDLASSVVVSTVSDSGSGTSAADDGYGHGTHVAGIAAGDGKASKQFDLNYSGIAPNADLITVKVLDNTGHGQVSWVLAGIDWVLANQASKNIRVVNMSLGMPAIESYMTDPLCQATKALHDAGIVTVVAAGNYGVSPSGETAYGSITSPGNSPWVITVGAVNDQGTPERSDDTVASYSSRGPTRSFDAATGLYDHLPKPDVMATGNHIVAPEAADNWIVTNYPEFNLEDVSTAKSYMFLNGTSMATPVVSGVAALMLEANPALTPSLVKAILMYTAQIIPDAHVYDQGSGQVNAEGAVRLASALVGAPIDSTAAGTVLLDPSMMPDPMSTLSGEPVPWSAGHVVLYDSTVKGKNSPYVTAGGILFAERVLFSEGIYSRWASVATA